MIKKKNTNLSDLSHAQAAEWLVRLEAASTVSEEDLVALKNWLFEIPENEISFSQAEKIWYEIPDLADDEEILSYLEEDVDFSSHRKFKPRDLITPLKAVAASILLFTIGFMSYDIFLTPDSVTHFQTRTGEQARYILDDGSKITLNTGTEIRIDFTPELRKITLERGEALFDVAPDKARPFTVYAGIGEIRALGTKFTVRKNMNLVTVALLEGEVKIETSLQSGNAFSQKIEDHYSQILRPGKQSQYSPERPVPASHDINLNEATEWTIGRISFSDTALSSVIEEVNRYTTTKLIIEGEKLGLLTINAYFKVDDIGSLLFALKERFNIHSRQVGNRIYLSRDNFLEQSHINKAPSAGILHQKIRNAAT